MQRQGSFLQAEYGAKKKQTRRDRFLAEMEQVVPPAFAGAGCGRGWWNACGRSTRRASAAGRSSRKRGSVWSGWCQSTSCSSGTGWPTGRWRMRLEPALGLDPRDSQALRGFAGIDLTVTAVPDETTILNFRHWLARHELSQALFAEVSAMLEERGLLMRQSLPRRRPGAQSSMRRSSPPRPRPRTRARARRATRRCTRPRRAINGTSGCPSTSSGAHIGVAVASGLVHTLKGTAANEARALGQSRAAGV
jgi:transposase, IS5 family